MPPLFTIKPIIPHNLVNTKTLENELQTALNVAATKAVREFKRTTRTWKRPVDFVIFRTRWMRRITTRDKLWTMLNRGVKPHRIPKKGKTFMIFPRDYQPKTLPSVIDSFKGGKSGPKVVGYKINHPGVKARAWDEVIRGYAEDNLREEVERRMLRAMGRIQF